MLKFFEKQRIGPARALSIALSWAIYAQMAAPFAYAQESPAEIRIVTVDGEGVANNVGQRSARFPLVRVEDETGKPVSGAAVVFTLPTEGASGEFTDGSKTLIVTTDPRGEAVASGLKANLISGKLQIHVSASYRGRTARTSITQFNMSVPGKRAGGSGKVLLIVLAIAGAAAAGGIAATQGSSGTPSGPGAPPVTPISITPGAGTVGGSR